MPPTHVPPVTALGKKTMRIPPALPTSVRPPRGLFVGRDGVLLERCDRPIERFADAALQPRVVDMLFRASRGGWNVYLVGNVTSVAHGALSDAAWTRFESELMDHLRSQGVTIARHYASVDHPQGTGKHKRDSVFVFPNTGALYHAAQHDGVELNESWLVSADVHELASGWRAGVHAAALDPHGALRGEELQVEPELIGATASELLAEVLAIGRTTRV